MKYKKISILVPVYNEEKTIKRVIDKLKSIKLPLKKEIIAVNDGSKDKTLEILKKVKDIKLISHVKNIGKGAAIRTALRHSTGDIILIQDADLEYNPSQIPILIRPILDEKTKVVYGTRFLRKRNKNWKIPLHYIGNRSLTFLTELLYRSNITDMETGYKIFDKNVIKDIKIRSKKFDFEPEITAKIRKKGYKIKEIPIEFNPRDFKEGKKITWIDGIKAAYCLIYYRFFD